VKKAKAPSWLYFAVSFVAVATTWWFLDGKASDPSIVPFFVGLGLFLVVCSGLVAFVIGLAIQRLGLSQRATRRFRPVLGLLLLGAVLMASRNQPIPVPDVTGPNGNAASSLHSTVGDVARFILAMSSADDKRLIGQMDVQQVRVSEHVRWGLGVGIQESDVGPAVFHWGRNPSMRAAFVIYPKSGIGAVVVVNLGDVGEAVAEVIGRALGGPMYWANE
jgi:hypothetical protein